MTKKKNEISKETQQEIRHEYLSGKSIKLLSDLYAMCEGRIIEVLNQYADTRELKKTKFKGAGTGKKNFVAGRGTSEQMLNLNHTKETNILYKHLLNNVNVGDKIVISVNIDKHNDYKCVTTKEVSGTIIFKNDAIFVVQVKDKPYQRVTFTIGDLISSRINIKEEKENENNKLFI